MWSYFAASPVALSASHVFSPSKSLDIDGSDGVGLRYSELGDSELEYYG